MIITVLYNILTRGFNITLGELAIVFVFGLAVGVIVERIKK